MRRRQRRPTLADNSLPYTTRFRSRSVDEVSNASLAKAFGVKTRPHFFLLCAALGPGSKRVVLVFEQDVERGERSVTARDIRSEEHTSELQSLMRTSYAVSCLNKKNKSKYTYRISSRNTQ